MWRGHIQLSVFIAARFAHAGRWRITSTSRISSCWKVELQATVVARHGAAETRFFFACGNSCFWFSRFVDACLALQLGHGRRDDLLADYVTAKVTNAAAGRRGCGVCVGLGKPLASKSRSLVELTTTL